MISSLLSGASNHLIDPSEMRCSQCHHDKQLDLFPTDRRRKTGHQQPCRQCQYRATQRWKQQVNYNRLRRSTRHLLRRAVENRQRELLAWARSN